jgi:hypothetical protein
MIDGHHAALTVAVTVIGAVSCASTPPDQGQPRAPISSAVQSPQQSVSPPAASGSPWKALPESLRAACGHPGAQAVVTDVPITVPKAQCDLTGVVVLYGPTGVTVPSEGGVQGNWDGISSSSEFGANVDPATGDVTFNGSVTS